MAKAIQYLPPEAPLNGSFRQAHLEKMVAKPSDASNVGFVYANGDYTRSKPWFSKVDGNPAHVTYVVLKTLQAAIHHEIDASILPKVRVFSEQAKIGSKDPSLSLAQRVILAALSAQSSLLYFFKHPVSTAKGREGYEQAMQANVTTFYHRYVVPFPNPRLIPPHLREYADMGDYETIERELAMPIEDFVAQIKQTYNDALELARTKPQLKPALIGLVKLFHSADSPPDDKLALLRRARDYYANAVGEDATARFDSLIDQVERLSIFKGDWWRNYVFFVEALNDYYQENGAPIEKRIQLLERAYSLKHPYANELSATTLTRRLADTYSEVSSSRVTDFLKDEMTRIYRRFCLRFGLDKKSNGVDGRPLEPFSFDPLFDDMSKEMRDHLQAAYRANPDLSWHLETVERLVELHAQNEPGLLLLGGFSKEARFFADPSPNVGTKEQILQVFEEVYIASPSLATVYARYKTAQLIGSRKEDAYARDYMQAFNTWKEENPTENEFTVSDQLSNWHKDRYNHKYYTERTDENRIFQLLIKPFGTES